MSLTRDQILSADDRKLTAVPVPEWGGDVFVKTMSGAERDRWERSAIEGGKLRREQMIGRLLSFTVCDESGSPLFAEDDIPAIEQKSAAALLRLLHAAQRVNALTEGDVDELVKNS